jgi:imidazolonepropionase-like amidohydrolase
MLHNNGVRLAIGSDHAASPLDEVLELKRFGPFDNLTILNIWCVQTPSSIFPERKLGRLDEGYEGSFIALSKNPLDDLSNIRTVEVRFKQGHLLDVRPD